MRRKISVLMISMTSALLLLLPLSPPAFAAKLDEEQVRTAAETYARTVTRDANPDAWVEGMEPYIVGGEIVAWIAHLGSGGYCLCGADDLALPVYFYVPRGSYDSRNPTNECILEEIAERTALYRSWVMDSTPELDSHQRAMADRSVLWSDLLSGQTPSRMAVNKSSAQKVPTAPTAEPFAMSLPLTSLWHQGSPYNDYCPDLPPGSGEHVVVGCVATSMTQVMDYWEWPNTGVGSGSVYYRYRYRLPGDWDEEPLSSDPQLLAPGTWSWSGRLEWVPDGGGRLRMSGYWDGSLLGSAKKEDFAANITPAYEAALDALYADLTQDSTYHYANMGAATYTWGLIKDVHTDPPGPDDYEVAELSFHAGIACEMGYGLHGSGSGASRSRDGMVDHFRYDLDAVVNSTSIISLTTDIIWLRPALILGCHHQWVILGYDKSTDPDRLFLRNMGWGGSENGWYTIDDYCAIGSTAHIYQVAPLSAVRFVGNGGAGDGTPSNPYGGINAALAAPSGTTIIFKAGESFSYMGSEMIIDKTMTLKGENVTIYTEY